ncbi:MAG: TonB-dependent receptor [Pseudomonadota bacterium]
MRVGLLPHTVLLCAIQQLCSVSHAAPPDSANLADLSFEELGNLEITSVSKRAQRLSDAAASIFVITAEDIRRSGVLTLPEAMRLAPNVHVGQVSASAFAITARGFNGSSANKLLVMVDGRSVYTPLFSGVFWDVQDVVMEDVERIEVISGPGGTLWGANAVNGVINIITRSARSTQGALVAAGGGNRESGATVRYGGSLGEEGSYRVYAKYFDRGNSETANGTVKPDAWYKTQVGFRTDWDHTTDHWMLQGNAYDGAVGQPPPGSISIAGLKMALGTITLSGLNLTSRWERVLPDGSGVSLQAYFDRTQRTVPPSFSEQLDIVDLQFQHAINWADSQLFSWGLNYRQSMDRVTNSPFFAFLPADVDQRWASVFAQDEISFTKDLRLTVGARLERNDYTGNEWLPNARLAWKMAPDQLLWLAASRTVRAPSRLDVDSYVPGKPPFVLAGGSRVVSEVANVLELGYRGQLAPSLSFSATAFHADYDRLRTQELTATRTSVVFASEMQGTVEGIEMWGTFKASERWRLSAGIRAMSEKLSLKPGSNDVRAVAAQEGRDPRQHWLLRSSLDLPGRSELECTLRGVAALALPEVPAYVALDLRYGWKPRPDLELSMTGQNLGARHGEFADVATRTQLAPSVFFKIVSRF